MLDQLKIGNVSSLDFGASVTQRTIGAPKKKIIKETVPFSNVIYDFSAINGELYWEERELEYVFEIIADSPEELEEKKTAFSAWIMNVMNEHIYDPYEPNYHYIGAYSDMEYADEDCVEKTTATVKFFAYPYKVKNEETVYEVTCGYGGSVPVSIKNDSAHRITPVVIADFELTITMGGVAYTFPDGEAVKDEKFKLEPGENLMAIANNGGDGNTVTISFYEEVF